MPTLTPRENSIAKWWITLVAARWEAYRRWHRWPHFLWAAEARVAAAAAFRSASRALHRIPSLFRTSPEWREDSRKAEWEQLWAAGRRLAAQQAALLAAQRGLWAACEARRNNGGHFLT